MAKLNIEELLGCLQEAAIVVQGISERQHINNLSKYFDDDGKPILKVFKLGGKTVEIPLFVLADHSSIGLETLEFNFSTRLLSDSSSSPSELKKGMMGVFRRKGKRYRHNIGNLTVDNTARSSWFGKEDKSGMAKVKVTFKKDEKPEAVSRLVDELIQKMDFDPHSHNEGKN